MGVKRNLLKPTKGHGTTHPTRYPSCGRWRGHYPPPSTYDEFLGLLLSLKSEVGTYPENELYALFDSICKRGQGYDAEGNYRLWSSTKPNGTRSIGSFVKGCMDGGWVPPKKEYKADAKDGVLLSEKGPLHNIVRSFAKLGTRQSGVQGRSVVLMGWGMDWR